MNRSDGTTNNMKMYGGGCMNEWRKGMSRSVWTEAMSLECQCAGQQHSNGRNGTAAPTGHHKLLDTLAHPFHTPSIRRMWMDGTADASPFNIVVLLLAVHVLVVCCPSKWAQFIPHNNNKLMIGKHFGQWRTDAKKAYYLMIGAMAIE